jgi:Rrf2 family transcriptional regulator, iron-sulfur cluster assembly transcription factor
MKLELTRRGDYAIRAMLALAEVEDGARLTAPQIAAQMLIPGSFLPQVMADLSRAGLVRGRLGRTGGYRLARPASTISLLEVIETIEGDSRRRTCALRNAACSVDGRCVAHDSFYAAQEALRDSLRGASLASIVHQAQEALPLMEEGHPA